MEAQIHTKTYGKIAIVLLFVLLIQFLLPICSNVTFAATTNSGLKYVVEDGKVYITGYNSKLGKTVKIPSSISGKTVVAVRATAFKGNKKITSVTIPDTVTTIATGAFKDCIKLKSVTISGSKLKNINKMAFYNCTSLAGFTMPDTVTNLGDSAFEKCTSLKTVKLSSGLTKISVQCFQGCSALTNVTIPKGVTSIETRAFRGAEKLATVTLEKGSQLITIGDYAFSMCNALKKMTVAGSTTKKDLKLPDTVTQIGVIAFAETNFSTIIIPDKIHAISGSVFAQCKNLEKVYYYGTNELKVSSQAFRKCTKLTNVYATIREVDDLSFAECPKLEKLYLTADCNLAGEGARTAFQRTKDLKVYSKKKVAKATQAGAKENRVDTEAPKVKVERSTTAATKNDVTVTITSTDGHLLKPIPGWEISGGYKTLTKTFTSNTNTEVSVKDFVGNVTKTKVKVDNIDKTAPQIEISNTTGTKWQNTPRKVKVKATDKSGIKSLKIQKVGSNMEGIIRGSMGEVELNAYGQYKVVAIDDAGNQKVSDSFWNYVDMDKPIINNVATNQAGQITAKVQDPTSKVSVNLIGNGKTYEAKTPDANGMVQFNVATTGEYTIKATDSAGNITTAKANVQITAPDQSKDDNVDKNEEEDKTETQEPEKPDGDTTVDDGTVKDETSNGEEEDGKPDEITTPGEQTPGNPDQPEVPVETNQNCEVSYDENSKTVEITKYTGTEDTLVIPETMEKDGTSYTVNKIAKDAFKNTGVKKVEISKNITQIEEGAFDNCPYLEKIIIKNENTKIDNNAITKNNAGIKIFGKEGSTAENYAKANDIPFGIYIAEGNYEYIIVDETFQEVTITSTEDDNLTTEEGEADETTNDKVNIEEKTETIAEILRYNGNDESVLIPSEVGRYKVSSIGQEAFKGNTSLKQIELPENMRKVKEGAFQDCTALNKVILRNKAVEIKVNAFKNTNSNLILLCGYDSTGMDYAKEKQIPYVLIHGAFMYELNEETKKATLLSARVGEGDPEYVTIEEDVGDYTLGGIKAGAFINTNLKGVIVKNRDVPIENVQLDPGALEGVEVGTLYCYEGSTADEYLKANSQLGIKVAYLGENGEIKPEEVTTDEEELNIKVGEEDSIFAKIYPTITTNKELNYKSNDETIVTVDENGKIKGINEGETTIEVTSKEDESKVATVNIKVDYIKLTLNLNGGEINLKGKTYTDQVEINVPYDYKISDIADPSKYGYEFKGWYEEVEDDEENKEEVHIEDTEDETITQDITLNASWEEIKPQASTSGDKTIADKILPNTGKATIVAISIIALASTAVVTKMKLRKM